MEKKYNDKPQKIWKREYNPVRSLVFWGWNNKNEPSLLILYGTHNFSNTINYSDKNDFTKTESILCDDVKYNTYIILNGKEGHLPSFENVKPLMNEDDKEDIYICYKKHVKYCGCYYYRWCEKYVVKNQKKFEDKQGITIPYFEKFTYEQLVEKVTNCGLKFENFKFAKNPNEVIQLTEDLKQYYELLCILMSNQNLNTRKRKLLELINLNPNEKIYDYIFKLGSVELLSGLFLEGAKNKVPLFIEKAQYIIEENINYANKGYINGLKRCANIYLNSLNKEKLIERENWINKNVDKIDLKLVELYNNEIKKDKVINGAQYRKFAITGAYYSNYKFEKTPFNDLYTFDIQFFKNFIQEAECYNMSHIIGKIAYYIDAPRVHYYFVGKSLSKDLNYFKRYLRRILFNYARNDENKFMNAVKYLLTSYTKNDCLCSFEENYQFNYFIKSILYCNFTKKAPLSSDWRSYHKRQQWLENDQLLAHKGRYEVMPSIWDNNINVVLEIASNTEVKTILKACYYILKDDKNINKISSSLSYKNLLKLSINNYEPLSNMFKEILNNNLNSDEPFDFKLMLELMNSEDDEINKLATIYLKNKNGYINSNELVEFILNLDLNKYEEFIKFNISAIKPNEYISFIESLICNNNLFKSKEMPKYIIDELSLLTNKINNIEGQEKEELLKYIINSILKKGYMERFIEEFLEESIFAFSCDEIKSILESFDFNIEIYLSNKNNMIINLVKSIIKNEIPLDSAIINILETGTSKTLNILFDLIQNNEQDILNRYSTLLILFESDISGFNAKAKEILDKLDKHNQETLIKFIIDSPVENAYKVALDKIKLLYDDYIPSELVMQMIEHTSTNVKGYILNKSENILNTLGKGDEDLFLYYAKTILLLPNKIRKNKENVYDALFNFVLKYKNNYNNSIDIEKDYLKVEQLLLEMGNSHIIKDKEKALVTLAKVRLYKQSLMEGVLQNASKI